MLAHSINEAGYVTVPPALETVITPSSSGCRSASSVERLYSGSSSRNSTPPCASEISPGCTVLFPPPQSETVVAVWWGVLNGRSVIIPFSPKVPATE